MNHSFNFCLTNYAVACCYDLCCCWVLSALWGCWEEVWSLVWDLGHRHCCCLKANVNRAFGHGLSCLDVVVAWTRVNHSTPTSHNNKNTELTWFLLGGRYRSSCNAMSDVMMCRSRPGDLIVLILICVNARFSCFCFLVAPAQTCFWVKKKELISVVYDPTHLVPSTEVSTVVLLLRRLLRSSSGWTQLYLTVTGRWNQVIVGSHLTRLPQHDFYFYPNPTIFILRER